VWNFHADSKALSSGVQEEGRGQSTSAETWRLWWVFSRFLSVLYSFLLSCVRSLICVQLRGSWLIRQLWCICGVISARQFALLTQPPIQLKSIHVHGNKILNCQCLQPSSHIKHISVGLIELINSQAIITFNTVLFAIIYQFFFICLKPYCPCTILYNSLHPEHNVSHRVFREDLAHELLHQHAPLRKRSGRQVSVAGSVDRFTGRHFPATSDHQRACVVGCGKRPVTICPVCHVNLCCVPCFGLYHTAPRH